MSQPTSPSRQALEAATQREWYHTIELAPGIVTPGWFDHRSIVDELPIPASLAGMRCLDIATFDGFWAFEMERRGAEEVVAADILDPHGWDWPAQSSSEVIEAIDRRKEGGRGFRAAHEALGSSVKYVESSVYDLDPEEHGQFDFIYVGSLLMHLRDPVRALERVRSICRGQLLVVDNINLFLTSLLPRRPAALLDGEGRPWWWKVNLAGLARMIEVAGFQLVQAPKRVYLPPGRGHPEPRWNRDLVKSQEARHFMITKVKGDPHAAVLAEPKPAEGAEAAAPSLHPIKLRAIDEAFASGDARSIADLGGIWAVEGGYTFHALEHHRPDRAVLVDEDVTAATRERAREFPQLELIEGNFGDPSVAARVGEVDAVVLFDVLLHQVAPDWDEVMALYAERARHLVIVQPQYVQGEDTVRLLDLGRERYLELVPDVPEHHEVWEREHEYLPERGRKYRDIHNIWQWGITNRDLQRRADELGFELVHHENGGIWQDRAGFENHAFLFRRRT